MVKTAQGAYDFSTVDTLWLRRRYPLFSIELSSRHVYLAGVSANPNSTWATQQARNLAIEERLQNVRYLIHDRDTKFSGLFDEIFHFEDVSVTRCRCGRRGRTPSRSAGCLAYEMSAWITCSSSATVILSARFEIT